MRTGWRFSVRIVLLAVAFAASASAELTIGGTLPNGTLGVPYTAQLTASGGTAPYHFSFSGSPPTGFTLSDSGQLSGTPTTTGLIGIYVDVADSASPPLRAYKSLDLIVPAPPPGPLTATTSAVPNAARGSQYQASIMQVSGGRTPYNSGGSSVPPGMYLAWGQEGEVVLTGLPVVAAAGSYPFTVVITDGTTPQYQQIQRNFTITVVEGLFLTSSLRAGSVGQPYSDQITVSGGTGPYTFTLLSGTLPPGIQLNGSTGAVTGTPTHVGDYTFAVKATDSQGTTGSANYSISIAGQPLLITPPTIPPGGVGKPYGAVTFVITGGSPPYALELLSGVIPSGMTYDSAQKTLSGTPTVAINGSRLDLKATDNNGSTGFFTFELTVFDIQPPTLPDGMVGSSYGQLVGIGPAGAGATAVIASGSLPPGLTFSGSDITGVPATAATYNFTVRVTVNPQLVLQRAYALRILPPAAPQLSVPFFANSGNVGIPYSDMILVSNGTPPYTFTTIPGNSPPGLSLASNGLITGTPTQAGQFSFIVNVVDSTGRTGSNSVGVLIYPPPLTIAPASIPNGTVGQDFAVTFSASGGPPPYTFRINASIPGLTFNEGTGLLSGRPAVSATYTFAVEATNGTNSGFRSYTLTIGGNNTLSLNPLTLPDGTLGVTYDATISIQPWENPQQFIAPSQWSILSGSLPPGLTSSSNSDNQLYIRGVPTRAGSFSFRLRVSDSGGLTATWDYSIVIAAQVISVGPPTLPAAVVSIPYLVDFTASGGTPPYTFSVPQATGTYPIWEWFSGQGRLQFTAGGPGTFPLL
jgi:hypothetical protein